MKLASPTVALVPCLDRNFLRRPIVAAQGGCGCREKCCRDKDGESGIQNDLSHEIRSFLTQAYCRDVDKEYAPYARGAVDLPFMTDRQHIVDGEHKQKRAPKRPSEPF
ncbi:hypothetical protein HGP14_20735 [Rhizobium sp. P32RR-XVIII]|uniref:hypothetical protein n=1 Tax=Rhizobium sp. P32RR-XVIII TaxID=2726738 RepID=UPI001456BEA8|nr:hypothetical protein [Rhizobium sp. P32RR-XVIII]NLS05778.1 hypothetical protein [Rhizobium sp. P32RR-XVIII]